MGKALGPPMSHNSVHGEKGEPARPSLHRFSPGSRSAALLLAIALLLASVSALAVAATPQAQVHPEVWEALRDGGEADVLVVLRAQADLSGANPLPTKEAKGRHVYETLWATAQESQRGLRALLDTWQADYRSFYLVNVLQVRADSALVQALAARAEVERILPNPRVRGIPPDLDQPDLVAPLHAPEPATAGIEPNLVRVGADRVWALGYAGQGIVVAGDDTGYRWDHPALQDQYRGWNGSSADHDYNWHDAIHSGGGVCGAESPLPCDDHGHGTHTMGIMVGDDGGSHQIGMAPGARWIGCRNMDQGWGTPASYIECFEFFLAPYPVRGTPAEGIPELAPHVVNNSWGCPPSEGCDEEAITLLENSVEALRQAGIVAVAAAGNYGSGCGSVRYPPAIYSLSLTVGNFDHRTDQVYWNSSRGPVEYGGTSYTKPDLSAPGVDIRSSLRGGGYGTLTGTSMSAPHVAGAVALLLSTAPGYRGQVDAIKHLLTRAAEPMTTTETCGGDGPDDVPNNTWGWGIVDIHAAVETVTGLLQGTVSDADRGLPIAKAAVTADLIGPKAITNPNGSYTLTLATGAYTLTAEAIGYFPATISHVPVVSGAVTRLNFALLPLLRSYLPLVAKDF